MMPRREPDTAAGLDPERWRRLMQVLRLAAHAQTRDALALAYSEKHRHYHTAAHIAACLALLDAHAALAERPHEIELALWFHDAVYGPLATDNEQKSADWAARFLAENGASADLVQRVYRLIMATRHHAPAQTADESLLLDIDLAILGAEPETYDVYEAAIRQEYRRVPMLLYRAKRAQVLQGFLQRPAIYLTAAFRGLREDQARANLARAIARLSS